MLMRLLARHAPRGVYQWCQFNLPHCYPLAGADNGPWIGWRMNLPGPARLQLLFGAEPEGLVHTHDGDITAFTLFGLAREKRVVDGGVKTRWKFPGRLIRHPAAEPHRIDAAWCCLSFQIVGPDEPPGSRIEPIPNAT